MWFTKLKARRRIKRLLKEQLTVPANKPSRQVCRALIKELHEELFRFYKPAMGKTRMGVFLYPNIDLYTVKLREYYHLVVREKPIPNDWSEGLQEVHTSVDWFLTSADGFYLNVELAVSQFRQAALLLLEALAQADDVDYGVYEHNFRMLSKLFINLRSVTEDLIAVSITNV